MERLDKDRYDAVSPLLDRALELTADDRARWLDSLQTLSPTLATDLAALLEQRGVLIEQRFLEGTAGLPGVAAGQTIGAYTLVSPIGAGGMGTVWLARRSDGRFEGQVAVKLLNAHLVGRQGERFEREGSILARLSDPHIAHLVDAGVTPAGQPYLVLEYVEGEPIDRYCETRNLGVEARIRLFLDVLDAVAHAHANLIVHRDLKPSNVLVRTDGQVKLLDFGIAKLLEHEGGVDATALTREGGVLLTPAYAAPEQMTGGLITTATDVYALGVLLHVLLAGRHPAGEALRSPAELFKAIVETEPARLSTLAAEPLARALRGDLDTVVAKALKKNAQERYPSVAALADDLRRHLEHQPITARPDTLTYRTGRFFRRHRLPVALAGLVLVALVAGLGGTIWQAREARRQRDLALTQLARAQGMNEFTTYLLGEAIPNTQPISVRELLSRSEALVEKRFARDEALGVDLFISISNVYGLRSDADDSLRTAKRAYETSLRLGDPAVRANAACLWAGSVFWDDRAQAERLIDGALALLPQEPQFNGIAASCLVTRAQIAELKLEGAATVDAAQKALDRLAAGALASSFLKVDALHMMAMGHRLLGQTSRAERAFAQASQELDRIGGSDTNSGLTLVHNWALTRTLTDPVGAVALQERVLAQQGSEQANDAGAASHVMNYGYYLDRVGRYAEARAALEKAVRYAHSPDVSSTRALAALGVSRACRHLGDLPCADAAARLGVEAMKQAADADSYSGETLQEPALLAAAHGDFDAARRGLSQALAIYENRSEKTISHVEALSELARLDLRAGRAAEADGRARQALALALELREDQPRSAWVGTSQVLLGGILEARGDVVSARALFVESLGQMTATLGPDHPAVKEARARLSAHP